MKTDMNKSQEEFLRQVLKERKYQREKWGPSELNHSKEDWVGILCGEVLEAIAAVNNPESVKDDRHSYESAIIQIAAVCMAAFEAPFTPREI